MKAKETYTTAGSVRGSCGHKHRSHAAAERCLAQDQRGCESQGGYSDRRVIASHEGADELEDGGLA